MERDEKRVFCPSCGTSCPDSAIACHKCGNILPGLTDSFDSATATADEGPFRKTAQELSGGRGTLIADRDLSPRETPSTPNQASGKTAETKLGRVKLVVEQGRILGEQFLLGDPEVVIGRYDAGSGRCPDIDLTAQDPAYVHRQHVRLVFDPSNGQLMAYDMGGRNGAYLNNQLIEKNGSALVQIGDKLRVGRVVLRVQGAPEINDRPSN